jgi:hypothetical protein
MVDTVGRGGAGGRVSVPSLGGRRPPAKRKRPQKERRKKPRPDKTAKPESSMKSTAKATRSKAQMGRIAKKSSGDTSPWEGLTSNQTKTGFMGSFKGGIPKDVQEFSRAIKTTEAIQKRNVVALKDLKNLKAREKQIEKTVKQIKNLKARGKKPSSFVKASKRLESLIDWREYKKDVRRKISDPARRFILPGGKPSAHDRSKATRAAKKADKERFQKLQKRIDREEKRLKEK